MAWIEEVAVVGQKIVIVVAGNAGHGKDTLADMLAERIDGARRDSFAAPLKVCVHLKTGIPMDILLGPLSVKNDVRFGRYGKSPRTLMQEEGQEARERIGKTVWMDRLRDRALSEPERVTIVSDGRHPQEEVTGIRESMPEGTLFFGVRIFRPSEPIKYGHPSEDKIAAAPDDLFDFKLLNDGSLDDLAVKADQLADAILLLAKHGKLAGFVVRLADGKRVQEPMATEADAQALAKILAVQNDGYTIEPARFDLITKL